MMITIKLNEAIMIVLKFVLLLGLKVELIINSNIITNKILKVELKIRLNVVVIKS